MKTFWKSLILCGALFIGGPSTMSAQSLTQKVTKATLEAQKKHRAEQAKAAQQKAQQKAYIEAKSASQAAKTQTQTAALRATPHQEQLINKTSIRPMEIKQLSKVTQKVSFGTKEGTVVQNIGETASSASDADGGATATPDGVAEPMTDNSSSGRETQGQWGTIGGDGNSYNPTYKEVINWEDYNKTNGQSGYQGTQNSLSSNTATQPTNEPSTLAAAPQPPVKYGTQDKPVVQAPMITSVADGLGTGQNGNKSAGTRLGLGESGTVIDAASSVTRHNKEIINKAMATGQLSGDVWYIKKTGERCQIVNDKTVCYKKSR